MADGQPAFLGRQGWSDAAKAVVAAEELEIALYERYRAFVSYGYYIARKTDSDLRATAATA